MLTETSESGHRYLLRFQALQLGCSIREGGRYGDMSGECFEQLEIIQLKQTTPLFYRRINDDKA